MMVGCITSALVVRILNGYSVYEAKLLRQGVNILRGHDESVMVNIPLKDVMETEFDYLRTTDSLKTATDMVLNSEFPHFPVLDDENKLAGILTLRDMRNFLKNTQDLKGGAEIVDTLMVRTIVALQVDSNLKEAILKFERTGVSFLPLVNEDNTVAGIIKSKDAMRIFRDKRYKNKIISTSL